MKCPACDVPLHRQDYENVSVRQCPKCHGYLANRNRVRLIKSSRIQSPEELTTERTAESQPDSLQTIRCPRCLAGTMRKEQITFAAENHFFIDVCPDCEVVWFDGGELARLQLDYEQSAQAVEAYAMRQRAQSRTAEETAEFKRNLESLPRRDDWLTSWAKQSVFAAGLMTLGIVVWYLLYLKQTWLAAGASLFLAGGIGWWTAAVVSHPLWQRIALTAVAAVEITFFVYIFL